MLSCLMSKLTGRDTLPTIAHEEFNRAVKDASCVIVDVREPDEYNAGHVPGARNLPLSRFEPSELPQGKPTVIICQAGGRSAKALTKAIQAGCKDVRHYAPGTGGWRSCGGEIVS